MDLSKIEGVKKSGLLRQIKPMLAELKPEVEQRPNYIYETKFDGIRIIAVKDGANVKLYSRYFKDNTDRFPEVRDAVKKIRADKIIIDGEIVTYTKDGASSFQELQNRIGLIGLEDINEAMKNWPAIFQVFDILYVDGYDTTDAKLGDRKKILAQFVKSSSHLKVVDYKTGGAKDYFKAMVKKGEEGVVAKDLDSIYRQGYRGEAWLKFKGVKEQEFVVGGWTGGIGTRKKYFGALIIGYYQHGELKYAAHVGSGYNQTILKELMPRLKSLEIQKCPFSVPPKSREIQRWVSPRLVVQVKFAQWTKDGSLRVPIYLGIRTDKSAKEVVRE